MRYAGRVCTARVLFFFLTGFVLEKHRMDVAKLLLLPVAMNVTMSMSTWVAMRMFVNGLRGYLRKMDDLCSTTM